MSEIVKASNTGTTNLVNGYSSIQGTDLDTRKKLYNAVSDALQLSDNLNKTINLKDVLVQPVQSENEETGEIEEYLRSTLIDDKGVAYSAGSTGIASSLKNMFDVFGTPDTWEKPLPIQVSEKKGRKGFKFFSISVL